MTQIKELSQRPKTQIVNNNEFLPDEKLRKWLEEFIAENPHLSTQVLSRAEHTGVSRTRLDAYLKGTYLIPKSQGGQFVENPADSDIEDRIRAYKNRVVGTERHGYTNEFVETVTWKKFKYTCKTAIEEKVIVLLYGEPGIGKSRALQKYKIEKLTTMPMVVSCSANVTTKHFVKKIARELKLRDTLSTADLEDLIAAKLFKHPRPLIVDQANYLNEKALGSICWIWEEAKIPVVLIGTKDLYELFSQSTLTEDVRKQLSSRLAWVCELKPLTIEEVKSICVRTLGEVATASVVSQIYNLTGGNHRHLEMVLPRIIASVNANTEKLASGDALLTEIIKQAGSRIMIG